MSPDAVPEDQRCCLHYLWVTGPNNKSCCHAHNGKRECRNGKHVKFDQVSKAMKGTKPSAKLFADKYRTWEANFGSS